MKEGKLGQQKLMGWRLNERVAKLDLDLGSFTFSFPLSLLVWLGF